mmetsp:Transcript_114971/g.235027  ORF Transcript_114971/g.235027 Transcript_114971/m.235027 type:complete len:302 (+) Transcript_114971:2-907(+)
MESRYVVRLIPGKGIDGDRYALGTGTYSAKFMPEPGKNLTMISADGVVEATERTGMRAFDDDKKDNDSDGGINNKKKHHNLGVELRRNIVLSGISAEALNEMVGHEVLLGKHCRVFVHRRCVPCKYREAACRRPGLMNNLWGVSGVNCEILPPIDVDVGGDNGNNADEKDNNTGTPAASQNETIRVGDTVSVIPNSYQPERINIGRKPPGFFIRPMDRSAEDAKKMIKPTYIAAIACLIDPEGFVRLEQTYNSFGVRFWTTDGYAMGLFLKTVRIPLVTTVFVVLLSIAVALGLHLAGIEV